MPNANPPSDDPREPVRLELIREIAEFRRLSILGHGEEINRFRYYLETLENYISKEESQELESLNPEVAKIPETRRGEF